MPPRSRAAPRRSRGSPSTGWWRNGHGCSCRRRRNRGRAGSGRPPPSRASSSRPGKPFLARWSWRPASPRCGRSGPACRRTRLRCPPSANSCRNTRSMTGAACWRFRWRAGMPRPG
ncbi:hypothetical protein EOA24_38320 [Mesorhizobium sp. M2A.F.Ca.ET.039.01.1.1]|nr:hypothetical protein EOA24_38320 [Mesorhizobium sp. M2A.F.Ca.ET.039.01.1.1]